MPSIDPSLIGSKLPSTDWSLDTPPTQDRGRLAGCGACLAFGIGRRAFVGRVGGYCDAAIREGERVDHRVVMGVKGQAGDLPSAPHVNDGTNSPLLVRRSGPCILLGQLIDH